LWDFVPLADELASDNMEEIRKKYLGRCMDEIQRRDKMGTLAPRMRMMYPSALAMAGRYQEAHACLNAIEKEYPEKKAEVLYQHALFYDNQGKWQDVYETIRALNAVAKAPNLMVDLLMVKTLMNLNLGVCAMEVAERSKRSFPGARQLDDVISAIWSTFGFKEQALFVLTHREATPDNLVIAALLHDTGRFREAEKVSLALGARSLPSPKGGDPLLLPPLAELTLEKLWPECVSDVDVEKERGQFAQLERESTSPFLRTIGQLGVEWCKEKGRGDISTPARWQAAGRDDMERAAALNRLTTLLACGRDYERAREAAQRAVEFMPASATLWKVFIALSEGGRDVVKMARAACPDDPDIWLASLVTRVRDEGPGDWALQEIQSATGLFSVGTMIRAGDFLLRKGMVKPAAVAAKDAISRGRGLLSAYVLGLSCALTQRDMKWAEACTLKGVELAADPSLFYKIMVDIKSAGKGKDIDLISALEYLRERFRNDPKWSERLGETYFVKGDTRRALTILAPVIERDIKKVGGQSLLLAAEAARLDGRMNQAIGILESAYKLYPDKVSVLNNLVYYLAQYPGGLQRAQELLPALQKMGGESPVVLDTVAKVHLRSGHPQLAAEFMKKALERLDMNDYAAQEVNFNAAEVMFRLGDYEGAKQKLDTVRRDSKASPLLDAQSRELLMQVEKAIKKK
jgi:tetratricopeptide (TPR) repeat protein